MFTDIEGSTALTQRLGDARAQELLRVHDQVARREIARWGGTEIKHTGDGVMATFESAASAVAAATAMQEAVRAHNEAHPDEQVVVNVGLNAGEPVSEDADVFGSAVQLAARACAQAKGGQVLATNVVRELVQGKGVVFDDHGLADLKGFDEPIRLFDVAGVEADWIAAAERGRPGRRRTGVWVGVAAVVALVLVGGAALVLLTRESGNDAAEAGAPNRSSDEIAAAIDADHLAYTLHGSTEVVSITGDCVSADTRVAGLLDQEARGDLVGVVTTEYDATIELARECHGMHLTATSRYDLSDGTFVNRNQGLSLQTLGDDVANSRFSSTIALGFLDGGTGAYRDATGFNICRSDTLRNDAELTNTSNCELWRYPADRRPDLVVASAADSDEVSTSLAAGAASPLRYLIALHNTSGAVLEGAELTLAVSEGAQVRAVAPDGVNLVSDLTWDLGALDDGEERWIELLVEVIDADDDLVLTPIVTIDDKSIEGWPATVRVTGD